MSFDAGAIEETLEALGIDVTGHQGAELQALCPAHEKRTGRKDTNPSWYVNTDSGAHICFSCGFKGSLEWLIVTVKGYDLDEAERFLERRLTEIDPNSIRARLDRVAAMDNSVRCLRAVPESDLALFDQPPLWARQRRNLTPRACQAYGVLWDERKDAWITPLREPITGAHHLLGWQEKGELNRYFMNRPPQMRKSVTLFGWHTVDTSETVIAVESPLDAVRLASLGIAGGVAFCGAEVSEDQYRLLRDCRVIVAFDNPRRDKAGAKAAKSMLKACERLVMECWFFAYGDSEGKDIGDISPDEIKDGLRNARHSVHGVKAIYA